MHQAPITSQLLFITKLCQNLFVCLLNGARMTLQMMFHIRLRRRFCDLFFGAHFHSIVFRKPQNNIQYCFSGRGNERRLQGSQPRHGRLFIIAPTSITSEQWLSVVNLISTHVSLPIRKCAKLCMGIFMARLSAYHWRAGGCDSTIAGSGGVSAGEVKLALADVW
jgi:hypothetical protein